jgi:hypothetical protein
LKQKNCLVGLLLLDCCCCLHPMQLGLNRLLHLHLQQRCLGDAASQHLV